MSVPLATLRRQSVLIWLHDRMALPPALPAASSAASPTVSPVAPRSAAALPAHPTLRASASAPVPASPWLRKAAQAPAPAVVRLAAHTVFDVRYGKRLPFTSTQDANAWLGYWKTDTSALSLLRGALQKIEPSVPVFMWPDEQVLALLAAHVARGIVVVTESLQAAPPAIMPAAPAPPAVAEPPAVNLAALLAPPPPPDPPLLPVLEEVQMEAVEVLPEIEQSLEQVNVSIGEINLAPVSLEPTPSRVPLISQSMTDASTSITSTLDGL